MLIKEFKNAGDTVAHTHMRRNICRYAQKKENYFFFAATAAAAHIYA